MCAGQICGAKFGVLVVFVQLVEAGYGVDHLGESWRCTRGWLRA